MSIIVPYYSNMLQNGLFEGFEEYTLLSFDCTKNTNRISKNKQGRFNFVIRRNTKRSKE